MQSCPSRISGDGGCGRCSLHSISVVIPTYNEAKTIESTIETLMSRHCVADVPVDVVVADGGSSDDTCSLARRVGAKVITRGDNGKPLCCRADCLNAGAAASRGDAIVFVHADTVLPPKWSSLVLQCLENPATALGAFRFKLDERLFGIAWVEWGTNLRAKYLGMPYGDQALFIRRPTFEQVGKFPQQKIMEDYEFVRRVKAFGRVEIVDDNVVTSARRWSKLGVIQTTLLNQLIIASYHLGISMDTIRRWY